MAYKSIRSLSISLEVSASPPPVRLYGDALIQLLRLFPAYQAAGSRDGRANREPRSVCPLSLSLSLSLALSLSLPSSISPHSPVPAFGIYTYYSRWRLNCKSMSCTRERKRERERGRADPRERSIPLAVCMYTWTLARCSWERARSRDIVHCGTSFGISSISRRQRSSCTHLCVSMCMGRLSGGILAKLTAAAWSISSFLLSARWFMRLFEVLELRRNENLNEVDDLCSKCLHWEKSYSKVLNFRVSF